MKFWICPKCALLNRDIDAKCQNCNVPIDLVLLNPQNSWTAFNSVSEAKNWCNLMKRFGGKVWIK